MNRLTKLRHRQKGLSSSGWLLVVGIAGLLLITFFKVFPIYYENFQLQAALESLQQDSKVDAKSKRDIWNKLQRRLFVNEVESIQRENVTMERKDGKTTVTVTYTSQDDWIGNMYIGARFVETIVIER